MRIGDQLELTTKFKDEKDKAARQAEARALIEHLRIKASYAKYPRQMSDCPRQRAVIARAFIGNPQLIVITHQKRTMEIADALYGVTMRDGVTTVVSQRLAD